MHIKTAMHLRNIAFIFAAVMGVLLWHTLLPSMLNSYHSGSDGMQGVLEYHKTMSAFARRPLTTWAVEGFIGMLRCKIFIAFTIVNFFFLFLNGILIYFLSFCKNNNIKQSLWNALFFYGSFSILFSFFAPIYTYDEPIQYFCLLSAMIFLHRKQYFFAFPFLFLSLVARETSVLLFPALYYLVLDDKTKESIDFFDIKTYKNGIDIPKSLLFSSAFLAYLGFNHWLFGALPLDKNRELAWLGNVKSAEYIIESIASAVAVLGVPVVVFIKSEWRTQSKANQNYLFVICITLIVNTLLTYGFSFARESRIFALPLLLFFPIASEVFASMQTAFLNIENLKSFFKSKKGWLTLICIALMIHFYYSTDAMGMNDFYKIYLGLTFFFIGYLHFLTKK